MKIVMKIIRKYIQPDPTIVKTKIEKEQE